LDFSLEAPAQALIWRELAHFTRHRQACGSRPAGATLRHSEEVR